MSYKPLQLAPYDGELIPSGYLFGEVSAKFTINYLKSIGAPETAVDKVKEIEVTKIVHSINLLKSASSTLEDHSQSIGNGYVLYNSETGLNYGSGQEKSIPQNILGMLYRDELPDNWSVVQEPREATGVNSKEYLNQKVYLYKVNGQYLYFTSPQKDMGEVTNLKVKDLYEMSRKGRRFKDSKTYVQKKKTDDSKYLCAMTYDYSNSLMTIDKTGKTPHIWSKLIVAVAAFSPEQAKLLGEKFENTQKNFKVDLSCIPEEIRESVVDLIMEPDSNYMQLKEKITDYMEENNMEAPENFFSNIPEKVVRSFAENFTDNLFELIGTDNKTFKRFVESGGFRDSNLGEVFPLLKNQVDLNTDSEGNLSGDFSLKKEMLLIDLTSPPSEVSEYIESIYSAVKSNYVGSSRLKASSKLGGKPFQVEAIAAPGLRFLNSLSNDKNLSDDSFVERLKSQMDVPEGMTEDSFREGALKLRKVFSDKRYMSPIDNYLSNVSYSQDVPALHDFLFSSGENGFIGKVGQEGDVILLGLYQSYADELLSLEGDFMRNYGSRKNKDGIEIPRDPKTMISKLKSSKARASNSEIPKEERDMILNTIAAISAIQIASFGDKSKDTNFLKGLKTVSSALSVMGTSIDVSQLVPVMKTPPVMSEGSNITLILRDGSVRTLDFNGASEEEKEEFRSQFELEISSIKENNYVVSSRMTSISTMLLENPDLRKSGHVMSDDYHRYFGSDDFVKVQEDVSKAVGSLVSGMFDKIFDKKRTAVMIGGIAKDSPEYMKFLGLKTSTLYNEGIKSVRKGGITTLEGLDDQLEGSIPKSVTSKSQRESIKKLIKSGIDYERKLALLSNESFVRGYLIGGGEFPSDVLPGLSSFELDSLRKDMEEMRGAFNLKNHLECETEEELSQKTKALEDYLVSQICTPSSKELESRLGTTNPSDFLSGKRQSILFESLAGVGYFVGQMNVRKGQTVKVRGVDTRFSDSLEDHFTVVFSGSDTFTLGKRKAIDAGESGCQIDMIGITERAGNTTEIDPIELKVSGSEFQIPHINNTVQFGKSLKSIKESVGGGKFIVRGVSCSSLIYGKAGHSIGERSYGGKFTEVDFSNSITSATEIAADGIQGVGIERKIKNDL